MAWVSLLAKVPWGEVLKNAPAVAETARKFWNKTRAPASTEAADLPLDADENAVLHALQQRVTSLQAEMRTAGEVIQSLAEQNAQLIARVEKSRRRLLLLALCNLVLGAAVLALWLR
ncbi:MAG: hypothetical protein ACK5JI_04705 [Azonexus sp.]